MLKFNSYQKRILHESDYWWLTCERVGQSLNELSKKSGFSNYWTKKQLDDLVQKNILMIFPYGKRYRYAYTKEFKEILEELRM